MSKSHVSTTKWLEKPGDESTIMQVIRKTQVAAMKNRSNGESRLIYFTLKLCICFIAAGPIKGAAGVLFSDNFDSYTAGAVLSSPWSLAGYSSAIIDSSTSTSPPNSVRIYGVVGGCDGSHAWRGFGVNQSLEVDFNAKCGGETLSGCHPDFVTVQLWDGTPAASDVRSLIRFQSDGNIYGGDWNTGARSGLVLSTYSTNVWYSCRVQYLVQGTNIINNFWINGAFCGTTNYPAYSYETKLDNISFASNEGTTWYDDIVVSNITASNLSGPAINIQKAVYLTSTDLAVGSNYQIQASSDFVTWTNQGSVFTATNSNWHSTNYWDVSDWNQLFFRLQSAP